jgi:hypothetical protein
VFNVLLDVAKFSAPPRQLMWTERRWTQMGDKRIYSSTWGWQL